MGMPIFTVPMIVALGLLVLLARRDSQRVIERFDHAARTCLVSVGLHNKAIPRSELVLTPWRSLGLVHFDARAEEGDRLRHVVTSEHRMFGVIHDLTVGIVPDYCYNLPIFAADVMTMGPRRILAVTIVDPTNIEAEHLQRGYERLRQIRRRFTDVLSLRNGQTTSSALQDLSFVAVANRHQDQILLQLFQDYLTAWLDMARAAPPLAPEMQQKVEASVEHYVDTLLEHRSPEMNFLRLILGPKTMRRWYRKTAFGLAA